MRADCPTLLRGPAPAARTWAQAALAAGQHIVTSAGKTDPADTRPPGESNSSVRKSSVQIPIQDDTVDSSEKLVSLAIHTSPGTSIVSQTSLLENVPNGTDHFMARPLHQIDADDTLEDDDTTGVTTLTHLDKQSTKKQGGSAETLDHGRKEKKPRHNNRSPRRDVIVPESPQSQRAHSLVIAQQVIEQGKTASHGTPTTED
ncbi:hypothetical protein PR048_000619 [Dryococelus australis]|uniref:Uncharacterized protein n=1 Tax=Dryococelus australis TaxID=614101 RepID=A0ABQ9IF56_9NEOP|nr:hypothetical protein PR048_000619 [Dryococelus australis]